MLSVLEVTQRVPPTCITNTNFTYPCKRSRGPRGRNGRDPNLHKMQDRQQLFRGTRHASGHRVDHFVQGIRGGGYFNGRDDFFHFGPFQFVGDLDVAVRQTGHGGSPRQQKGRFGVLLFGQGGHRVREAKVAQGPGQGAPGSRKRLNFISQ